jgi:hypothetical protein
VFFIATEALGVLDRNEFVFFITELKSVICVSDVVNKRNSPMMTVVSKSGVNINLQ